MKNSGPELQKEEIKKAKNSLKRTIKPLVGKSSMTQSLFSSKKTSFNTIEVLGDKINHLQDFHQTFGASISGNWIRPDSKRNSRKQHQRPETSKGPRYNKGP